MYDILGIGHIEIIFKETIRGLRLREQQTVSIMLSFRVF